MSQGQGQQELSCVVCQEPLWGEGDDEGHAPCSLRCGHLFGRSCIEQWIRRLGRSSATCPLCSAACALRDVWPVHVREPLRTIDAAQVEGAEQEAEGARKRRMAVEKQLAAAHIAVARARLELRRLSDRRPQTQHAARAAPAPGARSEQGARHAPEPSVTSAPAPAHTSSASAAACRVASVPIAGGRIVAFGRAHGSSVFASAETRPGAHGYARISLHDVRHRMLVAPHTKPVRGLVACPHDADSARRRVLTCGLDGRACVTSGESANVLAAFETRSACWACEWDPLREHLVYVAVAARREVLVYDLRRPCGALIAPAGGGLEMARGGDDGGGVRARDASTAAGAHAMASGPPYHALVALGADPTGGEARTNPRGARPLPAAAGLLCASQHALVFRTCEPDGTLSPAADALPLALGGCHALCVTFDAQLARGLVSFRRRDANAPLERGAVHALFARDGTQVGAVGGSTARLALARSALLVDGALRPLVAAGDEATCRPILWSVRGSRVVQELEAHAQPVVDIAQLPRSSVFATCSASRLDLYRLSASAGD
ncbi:hypothetical protein KFE25_013145 [Diacronema lutheri]|uniref:RING-type domain-containing protein n=1 Tax=Diacronema lutheri TaxID=2081491 RepID=A0A8J5XKL4_DIALT|nr:hypothetical protein KFE25_013145 [Diacronema lutheri]